MWEMAPQAIMLINEICGAPTYLFRICETENTICRAILGFVRIRYQRNTNKIYFYDYQFQL